MSKNILETTGKKKIARHAELPLTRKNYLILGIGLLVIVVGYVALAQKPWDSSMALVIAPILLVIGYCVIIPVGILYRKKDSGESASS